MLSWVAVRRWEVGFSSSQGNLRPYSNAHKNPVGGWGWEIQNSPNGKKVLPWNIFFLFFFRVIYKTTALTSSSSHNTGRSQNASTGSPRTRRMPAQWLVSSQPACRRRWRCVLQPQYNLAQEVKTKRECLIILWTLDFSYSNFWPTTAKCKICVNLNVNDSETVLLRIIVITVNILQFFTSVWQIFA